MTAAVLETTVPLSSTVSQVILHGSSLYLDIFISNIPFYINVQQLLASGIHIQLRNYLF